MAIVCCIHIHPVESGERCRAEEFGRVAHDFQFISVTLEAVAWKMTNCQVNMDCDPR